MSQKPTPVTIRGVHYPKMSCAAYELGVTVQRVGQALREGRLDSVGLGMGHRTDLLEARENDA